MARIKSNTPAPTQNINAGTLTTDALRTRFEAIKSDQTKIAKKWEAARTSGTSRGYDEMVAASQAVGFDWEALSNWVQADGRVTNEQEDIIRDAHNLFDAPSSPMAEKVMKDHLGLLSNACNPDIVNAVKKGTDGDTAFGAFPARDDVLPSAGEEVLKAKIAETKDKDLRDTLQAHLDAVNDRDAIRALCRKLGAVAKAKSRFRAGLFAHLLHPLPGVPESERGKHYEAINRTALAAHKVFGVLSGQEKSIGGPGERLRVDVTNAVKAYVETNFGKKEKTEKSDEDKAAEACNAVASALAKCFAADLITKQRQKNFVSEMRKAMADKFNVEWSTPEEIQARKKAEAKAEAEAKKLADDVASGKVAERKSRKARTQAAIKEARKSPPPAEPIAPAPQTDEDVLAELTA